MSADYAAMAEEYEAGSSLSEIAKRHGASISTVRYNIRKIVPLRTIKQSLRIASESGKLGTGSKNRNYTMSEETKKRISEARFRWSDENAKGYSLKPSGYYEYTTGEHKGRSIHVVAMEKRIGRRLKPDEHVHHIDGVKTNNDENNLALMTKSGHSRLHRMQDEMSGKTIERDDHGRFC